MNTWQTELLKELRTQTKSADLDLVIASLESPDHVDPGPIAAELRRIGLGYFADHVDREFYHVRARDQNAADGRGLGHTDVLKEDQADMVTGKVEHSAGNSNAVSKSDVGTATTDDNPGNI